MVHDRRIDGTTHTFGNAGMLFMNAMTWYDHESESIWSQPWGRSIIGDQKGVELFILPVQLMSWDSWRDLHPETLVMTNDLAQLDFRRQGFSDEYVIGLSLAEAYKAYYFSDVRAAGVINDFMGDFPVLLSAEGESFFAYLRQIDEQVLTFALREGVSREGSLFDLETGSEWDIVRGLATAGPLAGASLQPVPGFSSYDWAWLDFYPDGIIYRPDP